VCYRGGEERCPTSEGKAGPVNAELIAGFVRLLKRQAAGEPNAIPALRALLERLDRGYCLYNLCEHWRGAFSFEPGRVEALAPILRLARKLRRYQGDDMLRLYREPEWEELLQLSGPVEVVQIRQCPDCGTRIATMGTSGFYDAQGLVCPRCGNVYFKSLYDASDVPPCACGAKYIVPAGCASCGHAELQVVATISPYEYFADHSFVRGPGA
jgi:hypothetical protein